MTRAQVSRLFEIAAFERPLGGAERLAVGLEPHPGADQIRQLWDVATFERPLSELERRLLEWDLAHARAG